VRNRWALGFGQSLGTALARIRVIGLFGELDEQRGGAGSVIAIVAGMVAIRAQTITMIVRGGVDRVRFRWAHASG